jgi:hypothetical protein
MLSRLVKTHSYIFLISIVSLCCQQPLLAQEVISNKGTINVGFEGGVQFTGVDDPYMPVSDAGVGYSAGPYIEYFLNDNIKLRGGLNVDRRAFDLKDMGSIVGDSGYVGKSSYYDILEKFKVNYLTIPLSIIYIKGSDKFKFFIQGTLYYSLFLNAKQTGYTDVYISEEDAPHFIFEDYPELNIPGHHDFPPVKQTFNTSDIGINVFFGGVFFIKPGLGITISPGFSYSFGNVWENPERKANWSRLYKINAGIIYKLK